MTDCIEAIFRMPGDATERVSAQVSDRSPSCSLRFDGVSHYFDSIDVAEQVVLKFANDLHAERRRLREAAAEALDFGPSAA